MYKLEYIAFFAAISHSPETEEYLVESIKNYDIGSYLIVRETSENSHKLTNGDHYHFLVQMTNEDYGRFRKRVFLDHFKLKGRATKECGRQYGKVNYLKDPDRMSVYMMKDGSVVSTTFSEKQLKSWYDQSFKVSQLKGYKDLLKLYVDENLESHPLLKEPHRDVHDVFTAICELQVRFNRQISTMEYCADITAEERSVIGMTNSLTKAQLSNFSIWYITYHYKHGSGDYRYNDRQLTEYILNKPF